MELIRAATIKDAKDILAIYEPYILNTTITYEYDRVPLDVFEKRMETIMSKFPYLVYEIDGEIAGYAYASTHRERAAFAWDCEVSVYLAEQFWQKGIASKLYETLLQMLWQLGYVMVYALIDYPNDPSVKLHEKFGFTKVGIFEKTAYKFGAWRNLIILEKRIGTEDAPGIIQTNWSEYV